jgi:hypothetical protein
MLGGTANAAFYTGNWDPLYGGIFPELGWQASAVFDVPEACLAVGNAANVLVSECPGFDVVSAKVELYDKDAPNTILATYNLNPDVNVITNFDIAGGNLSGVDSGYFSYFVPSLAIAGGGAYSFYLTLFDSNKAQLVYTQPIGTAPTCVPFGGSGAVCGASANFATGVFAPVNPVPEPETYALMLAGLGAVSFIARRRRRR